VHHIFKDGSFWQSSTFWLILLGQAFLIDNKMIGLWLFVLVWALVSMLVLPLFFEWLQGIIYTPAVYWALFLLIGVVLMQVMGLFIQLIAPQLTTGTVMQMSWLVALFYLAGRLECFHYRRVLSKAGWLAMAGIGGVLVTFILVMRLILIISIRLALNFGVINERVADLWGGPIGLFFLLAFSSELLGKGIMKCRANE
jgi:hypothetical protein